jgi:hypothetical protein
MNSLWDIRIFLGLVPKESLCIIHSEVSHDYQYNILTNNRQIVSVVQWLHEILI